MITKSNIKTKLKRLRCELGFHKYMRVDSIVNINREDEFHSIISVNHTIFQKCKYCLKENVSTCYIPRN